MGKRRERRQQQASSRRVKLDLSTDEALSPSETPGPSEVLGSTLGEEVKAGARNKEAANDNPLSLLGQYSDDEADEDDNSSVGLTNNISNEAGDDFARNQDEQGNAADNLVTGKILDEKDTTSSPSLGDHKHDLKSFSVPEVRLQYTATTENHWQAVLHEDTGEYYYWNIQTGETTWVKPVSLENRKAGELASTPDLLVDFDASSVKNSELEIHAEADQGESGELDNIPGGESDSHCVESCLLPFNPTQDTEPGNAIACLESSTCAQPDLDNLKKQIKLAPDSGGDDTTVEKSQALEEPECGAGSDHGQHTKKVQDEEMDEEKNSVAIKLNGEDVKSEAMEAIQGALESSSEHEKSFEDNDTKSSEKKFPLAGESLQETEMGNTTSSDFQDASEGPMKLYTKSTTEEKMVCLAKRGDALQQRLNLLARDSLGGVSRHVHMALQAEARITDWKAFCALGFDPEACSSFIQNELTQLESVVIAEEAIELGRQKVVQSTTALEASHEVRSARHDADWSLNWGYYQQESSTLPEMWKQGQPTEFLGNGEDVEEGEIQTSYGEIHAPYSSISEGLAMVNNPKVSNLTGGEDVDMDVDMEVDDEVEAEPAVPGMSSDVPSHDTPVSYSYLYSLQGSNDVGTLAPLDSSLVGEPTHYFPTGDSWAPPLPPDDEWAPPPPGETEPAPPPPPDEPPPLPPHAPLLVETASMPSVPPEVQVHYLVPEYTSGNNQHTCAPDYQSVVDASMYGAFLQDVPGVVYSNSPQPTEALKVEQPYVVASVSSSAFNGWSAPVLPTTALSLVNPVLASEAPVKSTSYVSSVTASSTTADSISGGAISEAKKLAKGKVKKRTHAVAAAPMLNKKVSSLVNKWKQAKEELHGVEDDEDDKALYDVEILEKKRQKEIEEWRRQQIASGDALDNANFQPLGTIDWRERVKRAKRADSKERKEEDTGSEAPLSTVEGQNQEASKSQKPNLSDLSKGLPAGWQAYWDEGSGEVYYGNLITQETTWDRPVT